jgi:hypothetical protein
MPLWMFFAIVAAFLWLRRGGPGAERGRAVVTGGEHRSADGSIGSGVAVSPASGQLGQGGGTIPAPLGFEKHRTDF